MSAVLILCKTPLTSFSVAPLLPTDRTFLIISTLLEILNFLSSSVFFSLPSPCPVHCSVICSSFSFSLVPFLCYNSHLLFLSQALISHVAVSRQLQTHVHTNAHAHTHTCTYCCTCTGMEVIKARSKVCLITQLQWKLLVCFMLWYQNAGGGKWGQENRGGQWV